MINTLTLSYSEDGVAAATDHNYSKETYLKNRAELFCDEWEAVGGVGRNDIILIKAPATPSKSSFGVERLDINMGQAVTVPNPQGATNAAVATSKTCFSLPDGITPAERLEFYNRFVALASSDEMKNFILFGTY